MPIETKCKHKPRYIHLLKVKLFSSLFSFNWAPRYEGVLGSGDIISRILDLGIRWKWVVSFTLRPFYFLGKSLPYPLNRRLGGPQSRSRRGDEEKNSQLLPGLEPPIIEPVAQRSTTELSRLHIYLLPTINFTVYIKVITWCLCASRLQINFKILMRLKVVKLECSSPDCCAVQKHGVRDQQATKLQLQTVSLVSTFVFHMHITISVI
jgi:hypothetical protein